MTYKEALMRQITEEEQGYIECSLGLCQGTVNQLAASVTARLIVITMKSARSSGLRQYGRNKNECTSVVA